MNKILIITTFLLACAFAASGQTTDTTRPVLPDSLQADSAALDSILERRQAVERLLKQQQEAKAKAQRDSMRRQKLASALWMPEDSVAAIIGENSLLYNPLRDRKGSTKYNRNPRYYPGYGYDPIRKGVWWDRFFLGAFTGYDRIVPAGTASFGGAGVVGGFVGYHIQRIASLRGSAFWANYQDANSYQLLSHFSVHLDVMADIANYLYGWNENRVFSLTPLVGFGVAASHYNAKNHLTWKLRMGANLSARLPRSNAHIFVEPYYVLASDNLDYDSEGNPASYDRNWGIWGGIRLDLFKNGSSREPNDPDPLCNRHLFFETSVGFSHYMGPHLNVRRSLGGNYQLMLGKWFNPLAGLRAGGYFNDFYWNGSGQYSTGIGSQQVHAGRLSFQRGHAAGARIEVLLRPLNLWKSRRQNTDPFFDLDISGGFELGVYHKAMGGSDRSVRTYFLGYTTAADALFRVAPGFQLFLQPRFNFYNFMIGGANHGARGDFTDKLFTLNCGVRLMRPVDKDRRPVRSAEGRERHPLVVGVEMGTNKSFTESKVQSSYPFNWQVGGWGEIGITPVWAVHLGVEYMRTNRQTTMRYLIESGDLTLSYSGFTTVGRQMLTLMPGLTVDMANALAGLNDNRRWTAHASTGLALAFSMPNHYALADGELAGGTSEPLFVVPELNSVAAGFFATLRVGYNVTPHIGVYLSPSVQYLKRQQFMGPAWNNRSRQLFPKVSIGASYTF